MHRKPSTLSGSPKHTRARSLLAAAAMGSVARELTATARRPAIVVPDIDPQARSGWLAPGPIVCGIDESPRSSATSHVAMRLAELLDVALTIVTVADSDERPQLAEPIGPRRVPLGLLTLAGDPAEQLT